MLLLWCSVISFFGMPSIEKVHKWKIWKKKHIKERLASRLIEFDRNNIVYCLCLSCRAFNPWPKLIFESGFLLPKTQDSVMFAMGCIIMITMAKKERDLLVLISFSELQGHPRWRCTVLSDGCNLMWCGPGYSSSRPNFKGNALLRVKRFGVEPVCAMS